MRVGIIQSNYVPWRGYFDFIDDVDLFVFHDDLQYTKNDWRNRNLIRQGDTASWITVPVHYRTTSQRIQDTEIDHAQPWVEKHKNRIADAYRRTRCLDRYREGIFEILDARHRTISELNIALILRIMGWLDITTPTCLSSTLAPCGKKTERIISIMRAVGGTTYLSGPSGRDYLSEPQLADAGIALEYKTYDYEPYPQAGDGFVGAVSIIDLLANTGADARRYLKSRTPNVVDAG